MMAQQEKAERSSFLITLTVLSVNGTEVAFGHVLLGRKKPSRK